VIRPVGAYTNNNSKAHPDERPIMFASAPAPTTTTTCPCGESFGSYSEMEKHSFGTHVR
jgi:hypothetical protein